MGIPNYVDFLLPLLQMISDRQTYAIRNLYQKLPIKLGITEEETQKLLPSGQQTVVQNRIGWARTYLKKAKLIEQPQRGQVVITQRGIDVLKKNLDKIDVDFLRQFPEFLEFKKNTPVNSYSNESLEIPKDSQTPDEVLESAYEALNNELSQELLQMIKAGSPQFFEYLVVDLLVNMGYGGSRKDAAQVVGKSGDEGIDGIIKEDRLGLDVVYVQAKRWDNTIGRPEIQKFAGALQGQRAKKGIYITTSSFTKEAINYASGIDNKIILIDGSKLAQLMIEFNVGVSVVNTYEIKKLNVDYFEE